tara:strand:- start:143 stop:487 length:345 start_codon:yes stop_codon:yes gene_type:complete
MHCTRLLFASCCAALLSLTASCETVGPNGHVTRTYEVKDLVLAQEPGSKPFLPMYALLVNIVKATELSELPKGTYTVRPEARGVLLVTAPAKMQDQVATVLADLRSFAQEQKNG